MEKSKVSIIIPAYNASAFIVKCLDSVIRQTYPDFEVIIVNDGSTDNTLQIIDEYAKKDKRIKVFTQENSGVSFARNTALSKACGEYITYVDADDTLPETAIEDMVTLMTEDTDFVIGSHYEIRFTKKPHLEGDRVFKDIKKDFIPYGRLIWWPWGKLYRASIIFDNNLQYDTGITFGEDHIFNLLYSKHIKNKVAVTNKIVYNYHFLRGGLSSKYYDDMNELQKYILLKIAECFGSLDEMPTEYKRHYSGAYLKGLVDYYCAWLEFSKAVDKIKESFELYSDVVDDETLKEHFTTEQFSLIKSADFSAFTKNYIIKNPKKTILRKIKRTGRRIIESTQNT